MDDPEINKPLKMPEEGKRIDYSQLSSPEPMGRSSAPPPPPAIGLPPRSPSPSPSPSRPSNGPAPHSSLGSILLMIFLAIVLVAGVLVFFSWKGWISLGGIEKLWGGGKTTPTPTVSVSVAPSPTVSAVVSSSPASSPQVNANVNDQTRKADLTKIKEALVKYFAQNNQFPVGEFKTSDASSILAQDLVPQYIEKLPDDPLAPQFYYGYKSDGKTFELTAVLEDKTDPEGTNVGQYHIYKLTGSSGT